MRLLKSRAHAPELYPAGTQYMLIHFMDHLLKQPDVDFFLLSPYHVVTPLFLLSRPDAGLVAYLILNASRVGNTVFPHHHSFRPQGRHFSGPPTPLPWVSSLNFLSLLDLHILTNPSRLKEAFAFCPPAGKPDQNQTSPVCPDAVECWRWAADQSLALPSPYGESGFGGSVLGMAAGKAARPSASPTLPHPPRLPGSTWSSDRLPPSSFFSLLPVFFPPLPISLAALLAQPEVRAPRAQSLALWLLSIFIQPWGESSRFSAFRTTYEPMSPRSRPPGAPGWLASPHGCLLSSSDFTQSSQGS